LWGLRYRRLSGPDHEEETLVLIAFVLMVLFSADLSAAWGDLATSAAQDVSPGISNSQGIRHSPGGHGPWLRDYFVIWRS
jgi:hypothetical protein